MIWFALIYQSLELFKALQEHDAIQVTITLKQTVAIPLYITHLICTYLLWRSPSQRSLDAAHLVLAAAWIWKAAVYADYWEAGNIPVGTELGTANTISFYHYQYTMILFFRFLQGIILGNATLTSVLHVIWVVCDVYFDAYQDYWWIYAQIYLGIAAAAVSWVLEFKSLAEVKSAVEEEKATGAYHQVSRVLGAMCDAVVTLNDELCISGGPVIGGPGDGPVNGAC